MSEAEKINLDNISVDETSLYREEMITDLKAASMQVLTPVKVDGSVDETRQKKFVAQTQLMSRAGVLPVTAHIEAESLADAIEKFPEAVKEAVDRMVEEAREMQRQEASRIVVPSIDNPGSMPGAGGGITLT
jgi:hypothetical protein